jgi:mannosyltransferase
VIDRRPLRNLPLALLVLSAFFLRTSYLTRQSLWPDEVYSYVVSHWSLAEISSGLRVDNVPLYTLLLGGWQVFAGSSEFSLRYLSVVISTLAVPLGFALGRRLLGSTAGFVAALLLAISPFQLYFAQEIRMYALVGTLAFASSWVLLRWMCHPPRRVLAVQGLLYAALIYTHFAGFFVLATHLCILLLSRLSHKAFAVHDTVPKATWRWVLALGGGLLFFLPWTLLHVEPLLLIATGQTGHSVPKLFPLLTDTLIDLTFGNHNGLDVANPIDARVLRHLSWASLILPVLFMIALLPDRKKKSIALHFDDAVAALHIVIPYALLIALVQIARDFATRYAFPATVWVPILAVAGLWRLPRSLRLVGSGLLVGYSLWGSLLDLEHPGFARVDFRSAIDYIADHRTSGDAAIVSPDATETFDYYSAAVGMHLPRDPLPLRVPMDESQTSSLAALDAQSSRLWRLRWEDYYYDPHDVIGHWLGGRAIKVASRQLRGGLGVELWLTRPPVVAALPPNVVPDDGDVGHVVHLVGHQITEEWPNRLTITFYWKLDQRLGESYTVFIHLIDQNGHHLAQADGLPYDGQFPTTRWPAGQIIRDVHEIQLGPAVTPGEYHLNVGFYVLKTMQRLGSPGDDTVRLVVPVQHQLQGNTSGALVRLLPPALRLDEMLAEQ